MIIIKRMNLFVTKNENSKNKQIGSKEEFICNKNKNSKNKAIINLQSTIRLIVWESIYLHIFRLFCFPLIIV